MEMQRLCLGAVLLFASGVLVTSAGVDGPPVLASDKLEYNRDIRPILSENCFACHGTDSAARKGGLRLDQRDSALKKKAIIPGKVDESELVKRILSEDTLELMPPPESHKTLTPKQKQLLKDWIAQGGEYQAHWSLITPKRPAAPTVKNKTWVRNPIDAFVLAELEKRNLAPAPEADRRVLARRVSFDLTGLPPLPADVDAFVADKSPDAYERYVDKLLASPNWGEHRGRYWLDYARYADTHGIHMDNFREMWAYRDWVIKAFNRNQPFDQFTTEQLAGDLLPNPTLEQRVATGFNRCNITTSEGGAIDEEYLVLYARDRTETFGQVYLGLTAGCAVCHDHKFDPLPMRDFYSLSAFFNNTTQRAMDGNIKDTPPVVVVPIDADRPRWDAISKDLATLNGQIEERKKLARGSFDKWLQETKATHVYRNNPTQGLKFQALLAEGAGNTLTALVHGQLRQATAANPLAWETGKTADKAWKTSTKDDIAFDDAGDFDTKQPFSYGAWVYLNRIGGFSALMARMDDGNHYRGWDLWQEDGRVGTHIVSKWMDDALKVTTASPIPAKVWTHVLVTYDGSAKAAGVKIYVNGVEQLSRNILVDKLQGSIKTPVPLKLGRRHNSAQSPSVGLQDARIYDRVLTGTEAEAIMQTARIGYILAKPTDKRTDVEKNEIFTWWLPTQDEQFRGLIAQQKMLGQEEQTLKARGTVAHVMNERSGEPTAYILKRGEYDKRLDLVKADTPKMLPGLPAELPRNRMGLAKWLCSPEHPLMARVTVNRFWQEIFGTGIVRSSGDFGVSGEMPSHPELLDWLAVEFRESGWDTKKFFKLIVTSNTYRQAATTTPEKLEKDPANRFYSRGPRFRMDAEMVRDNALAVSGLLVRKLGGPSVKPYQPDGVWEAVAMNESNTKSYKREQGDKLYRRSLYTFWKRSAPPASMDIFNAPNRETCTVRRERTNTPLQALATLNDVQHLEAARVLAQDAIKHGGEKPEGRIEFLGRRLLARPFTAEELKIIHTSLQDLHTHYDANQEDAKKLITIGESKPDATIPPNVLASWTMVANQLMNLDEVLNK
jgi:hypothetical protein